jgi:group I intron endonuclease
MIVYYIFHRESGMGYVGKFRKDNVLMRYKQHKLGKSRIGNALRKYGDDAFKVVILDTATSFEELGEKEIFWIDQLETFGPGGYNLTPGGDSKGGWKPTDVTKLAISLAKKGRPSPVKGMKLRPWTEEEKRRKSIALKGRLHPKGAIYRAIIKGLENGD